MLTMADRATCMSDLEAPLIKHYNSTGTQAGIRFSYRGGLFLQACSHEQQLVIADNLRSQVGRLSNVGPRLITRLWLSPFSNVQPRYDDSLRHR